MAIPAGLAPMTVSEGDKLPYIKLNHGRAEKGDFITGNILSAKEKEVTNDDGYKKIEVEYVIAIEDWKLSDYEKIDGTKVKQEPKKGEKYLLSATKNNRFKGITRQLEGSVWPRKVHIIYDGKELYEGKKLNNFKVYAAPNDEPAF